MTNTSFNIQNKELSTFRSLFFDDNDYNDYVY